MKKIHFLIFLFILVAFTPLPKEEPTIIWSSTQLTWNDFHGKMKKNSSYDAVTVSAISTGFSGENNTLTFDVKAVFFPKSSNKKPKKQSIQLLKHEQGHFDITELFARKLRKSLQAKTYKSYESISKNIDKVYNKNNLAWQKMQRQYDKDTEHSKKKVKQEEWNTRIKNELAELDKFKTTSFTIDISYLNQ
jgi:hypothetical protein